MQVDFTFQEYLGFLAFLGIATMGFWLMIFLSALRKVVQLKNSKNKNKLPKISLLQKPTLTGVTPL